MSSGKRSENEDSGKSEYRLPPFSRESRAHQQQQQMFAQQNLIEPTLMGYLSSNDQKTQAGPSLPVPGFARNSTNFQADRYPAFMGGPSSFNNQNFQSGQSSTSMCDLMPSNAQSGAQQSFAPGISTNTFQQTAFAGVPSSNMNAQMSQNTMMLWNFFSNMMNMAGSQMATNPNLSTGNIAAGEITNTADSQMATNPNLSTGNIAAGEITNSAASQMATSPNSSNADEITNTAGLQMTTNQNLSPRGISSSKIIPLDSSFEVKSSTGSESSISIESSELKHKQSQSGSSRTLGFTGTPTKKRKIKGFEYEEVDPKLTVKDIQKAYGKTITTVMPKEDDQSFEMYNVVRRLQRNKCVIPFFFRCEVCEKIFYVHTVKNHGALTRHFTKCNGPVQVDRSALNQLLEGVLDIGAETGSFGLTNTVFPSKITDENVEHVLTKMRQELSQQKTENEDPDQI